MDSIRRRTTAPGFERIVAALALLLAVSAPAWAQQEETQQEELPWGQVCDSKWEDSPASDYCTGVSITRIGTSTAGDTGDCRIKDGDCSIEVTVGRKSATFHIRLWSEQFTPDDTATLDLCFYANSTALYGYYVALRGSCDTGETDSSTATSDGLPAT